MKFREGTKQIPPSGQNEVREVEVVQHQIAEQRDNGPTAKKLIVEESFDKIDEEVPGENIHDSVKIPIAQNEE